MKIWAIFCMVDGRWRQGHAGYDMHDAMAACIWYQSMYGGEWCASRNMQC